MHSTEPNIKRKNQAPMRVIVNRWGFLLGFFMLGLGGILGLFGAIFIGPQLLGFDVTATALMEQEIMLVSTQVEMNVQAQDALARATDFALDVQATQAIINNNVNLLEQTATQSAQYIIATNTASAVQNAQRQTQVSNDFSATQAALNANATQVGIDFRNTQAVLGINSDAQAEDNTVSTPLPRYTFDMSGIDLDTDDSIWQVSNQTAWESNSNGIVALEDGAQIIEHTPYILNRYGFENSYTVETMISPAMVMQADYWILFGMTEDGGLLAHFRADTLNISEVGLYRFDLSALDDGLRTDDSLTVIQRVVANISLTGQTQLSVAIDGGTVNLLIDDDSVLQAENLSVEPGSIGVQLPAGAGLVSIAVSD